MKKLCLLIISSILVMGLSAQENPRPELSKKEVRQYHRKLKKLNASLKKKTARLERFLNKQSALLPDSLGQYGDFELPALESSDSLSKGHTQQLASLKNKAPKIDSLALSAELSRRLTKFKGEMPELDSGQLTNRLPGGVNQLKQRAPNKSMLGSLPIMGTEIDELKRKLQVGKSLSKGGPEVKGQMEETVLELTDIEYELKDLEVLKSKLKNFELDSAELKKYLGPLNEELGQIQGQVGEYKSLLDGHKGQLVDWDKSLEKEIMKLEEVQGLAKYTEQAPPDPAKEMLEAQKTIEKGFQSKEYVNKLIQQRFEKLLKEEGPDALSKRLQEGHEKLAEYKRKGKELESAAQTSPKKANPMRAKSLRQRLRLGTNLQLNRQKPLTLDAGLDLAYQLNPRAEFGVGGAYRFKLEKRAQLDKVTDLLNVRSFYHHRIWRSLGIQGNYELNYALPRVAQPTEDLRREWSQSALIGLRNEYSFLRKLGAYTTLQYDLLHNAQSPNSKWVFRFGFRLK